MIGLYVHVPFCSAICNYCNFNRGLYDAALKARYVDAVVREIHGGLKACATDVALADAEPIPVAQPLRAGAIDAADTIYFGGGTPSLLAPEEIDRIIRACEQSFDVVADREVTLEANPDTVSEATLAAFRAAGVNRVSFGVQSFREEELRRLSRLHDAERARAAVREARAAGFDNVSLDLMMWLPEQSVEHWFESIDAAIEVNPDHLSLYLLELYPNAPLRDDMARARWSQAPDEDAATMYVSAMERLESAGYEQYEISNVARPGRRSRHNLKYWTDGEWLGFGCGAHSTRGGARYKNVASTDEYIRCIESGQPTATDVRRLTAAEWVGDALFTGLRLCDGIDLDAIRQRYGVDVWSRFGAELAPFVDAGCLLYDGRRLCLTRQGMLVANEVMAVFV